MIEKIQYVVTEILKQDGDWPALQLLENSEYNFQDSSDKPSREGYPLFITVLPTNYTKNYSHLKRVCDKIKRYVNDSSGILVSGVYIKPDLNKVSILNSEISVVETPWEEINSSQKKLINNMRSANSTDDFQNIGNTSRSIMDKLARLVFNPEIHIPPQGISVANGKFKNQLHTFLTQVLSGNQNSELKKFSKSAVDFTENAIDLMNQTTHKLDVQKHFAEICVISTLSVINLIKTINEYQE